MRKTLRWFVLCLIATPLFGQSKQMDAPGYQLGVGTLFDMSKGSAILPTNTTSLFQLPGNCTAGQVEVTKDGLFFCGTAGWLQLATLTSGAIPLAQLPTINLLTGTLSASQLPATINANTTGNAATATAFASAPTKCTSGLYSQGISASGDATCSQVQWSQLGSVPSLLLSSQAGVPGGLATLDSGTHVPLAQIPTIPYTQVSGTPGLGTPNGVATLDSNTHVPVAQLPTIPYTQLSGTPSLGTAASHAATDFLPSNTVIPTDDAQLANGAGYAKTSALGSAAFANTSAFASASLVGQPNGYATLDVNGHVPLAQVPTIPYSQLSGTPSLAAVATTGAYSSLTGTPSALPPNGSASGDLGGTYPSPTVTGINGQKISLLTAGLLAINGSGVPRSGTLGDVTGLLGYTPLNPANNLSEINAAAARINLGLGTAATSASTAFVADPGTNGLVKRTGAGTSAVAGSSDITGLLGYSPENVANKGAANGYAPLDASSKVPLANVPTIPFSSVSGVPSYVPSSSVGAANGVASLDANGLVPFAQIPPLPAATTSTLGEVKIDGASIHINSGVISVNDSRYDLAGTATSAVAAIPASGPTQASNALITPSDWATFNGKQNALGYTPLNPANNLSEITNPATARSVLQLGTAATQSSTAFVADTGSNGIVKRTGSGTSAVATGSDVLGLIGFTPENAANKNQPNGYAPLDASAKVPLANIPVIPFGNVSGVPSYVPSSSVGAANGVASLDGNSLVPPAQLPVATTGAAGIVQPDGTSITATNGVLSVNPSQFQAPLGFTPENTANKGVANGYASLNASGQLSASQVPPIPFTDVTGVPNYVPSSTVGQPNGVAPLGPDGLVPNNLVPQPLATTTNSGDVKPDGSTILINNGVISVNQSLYDAAGAATTAVANIPQSSATQTKPALITPSDWAAFNGKQNALGYTAENTANKGVANGYASLDANGRLLQPATIVQLAALSLPACDSTVRGKIAFAAGSGTTSDQFFGCENTGSNAYSWVPLVGGGGGQTNTSPLQNFSNTTNVSWTHGLATVNLVGDVWDGTGQPIGYTSLQLTDANDASLAFATLQSSGAVKVTPSVYNQTFTNATSVTVTHNLNSLNIVPVIFDAANNVIEPSSFTLTDANTATVTFAVPQSGTVRIYPITSAYSQSFSASTSVAVPHNLNTTQLAVAAYDSSNNLIGYTSFVPADANNAVLNFAVSQAGRVVLAKP